jgi:hypothetical protein
MGSSSEFGWRYIDSKGETVIPNFYCLEAGKFKEGLARIAFFNGPNKYYEKDGLYGYIDKSGKTVIAPAYVDAKDFSDGLAPVKIKNTYGYIDKKGTVVCPFIYGQAESFHEGFAYVKKSQYNQTYVDTNFKEIWSSDLRQYKENDYPQIGYLRIILDHLPKEVVQDPSLFFFCALPYKIEDRKVFVEQNKKAFPPPHIQPPLECAIERESELYCHTINHWNGEYMVHVAHVVTNLKRYYFSIVRIRDGKIEPLSKEIPFDVNDSNINTTIRVDLKPEQMPDGPQ